MDKHLQSIAVLKGAEKEKESNSLWVSDQMDFPQLLFLEGKAGMCDQAFFPLFSFESYKQCSF